MKKYERGSNNWGRYGRTSFVASLLLMGVLMTEQSGAQTMKRRFQYIVDTFYTAHPAATGIMVSIAGADGKVCNYAAGVSDRMTHARLKSNQPVLLASNTKTYVAAAILKLCEQKKLNLFDSIGQHLSVKTIRDLREEGYATQEINITHLLSHTSGIDDYVNDEYFDFVNTHRQYKWTRQEQITRAMKVGSPLASPGDTFRYADVNYLLLTEIIEQITHGPFYKSIRLLLNYNKLLLNATWFLELEPEFGQTQLLAHQYWAKYPWDSYSLNPSWDLYGGGGIAATPDNLSRFFKYLFEGKIIRDTGVLAQMYTPVSCKTHTNYCLGLRNLNIAGLAAYYHGGFWGTDAIYLPALKAAISIVILEKQERDLSANLCKIIVEELKAEKKRSKQN